MKMSFRKVCCVTVAALFIGVGSLLPNSAEAQTYTATVGDTNYDFSTFSGTYTSSLTTLQSQFWWAAPGSAEDAATAVGSSLGMDQTYGGYTLGPMFMYGSNVGYASRYLTGTETVADATVAFFEFNNDTTYTIAQAAVAVPEINGSTIPLLAFILGVIGLGLRGRSNSSTFVIAAS